MAGALRELFAEFGIRFDREGNLNRGNRLIDQTRNGLRALDPMVARLRSGLGALGVTLGGIAMVRSASRFVSETIQIGDELDKTSQQLGLSTHDLQAFRIAADLSGASAEQMNVALAQLSRRLYDAGRLGGENAQFFQDLGIETTNAAGQTRNLQEVMDEIADVLARTDSSTERVGIAMTAFGRSGARLLPMLQGGSEALQRMRGEVDELGGGMSEAAIRDAVVLQDNLTRLKMTLVSVRSAIAVRVLPAIDSFVQKFTAASRWISEVTENSNILKAAVVVLSGVLVGAGVATVAAWGPVVLTVGIVALAIAGLILVVDDLWTHLQGGESVTGDVVQWMHDMDVAFLEWALGAENATKVIQNWNQGLEDLKNTLASIAGYLGFDVGEEGTDVRRASTSGRQAAREDPALRAVTRAAQWLTGPSGEAPQLSAEDQAALAGARTQVALRAMRAREGSQYFEAAFPELATMSHRPELVSAGPQSTQQVTVDAPMTVNMNINEATDAQAVNRVVVERLREAADRQARQLAAALLPEGAR